MLDQRQPTGEAEQFSAKLSEDIGEPNGVDQLVYPDSQVDVLVEPGNFAPVERSAFRKLLERGMATAEYAVGILAAIALALVLLKIFQDQGFISKVSSFIGKIFQKAGQMIG